MIYPDNCYGSTTMGSKPSAKPFFCVQTWPNLIQEGNISQVDYNSTPGFVGDPTPLICLLAEILIVIAVVPDVDGRKLYRNLPRSNRSDGSNAAKSNSSRIFFLESIHWVRGWFISPFWNWYARISSPYLGIPRADFSVLMQDLLKLLSGRQLPSTAQPFAHAYGGHQCLSSRLVGPWDP